MTESAHASFSLTPDPRWEFGVFTVTRRTSPGRAGGGVHIDKKVEMPFIGWATWVWPAIKAGDKVMTLPAFWHEGEVFALFDLVKYLEEHNGMSVVLDGLCAPRGATSAPLLMTGPVGHFTA